jgi:hypothetical protein
MGIFAWLGDTDIGAALDRIEKSLKVIDKKVSSLMASFEEAKQNWVSYATDLKTQRDEAVAALTDAQQKATDAATALQQFQDDDAATDASQLADQAQAFADDLQNTLDGIKDAPPEPEPLPDPGNPSQAPTGDEPQVNPL